MVQNSVNTSLSVNPTPLVTVIRPPGESMDHHTLLSDPVFRDGLDSHILKLKGTILRRSALDFHQLMMRVDQSVMIRAMASNLPVRYTITPPPVVQVTLLV